MTTSKLVCILGLALVTGSWRECVHGKRQQPSHDEIERIINQTHSVIWKCSTTECHPGSGLNVQCGTSISIDIPIKCVPCVKGVNHSSTHDYSTCKSCRNCAKHENKTGECTPEEDTTECLGTCHNGFYMDKITVDCHPCSDCCNIVIAKKHHEEQCKNSGLPPNQWCRQSNIKCPRPTKQMTSPIPNNPDNEQGGQGAVTISLITISIVVFILVIVFLVLLRCYGWEQVKSFLTKCCRLVLPTEWNTVSFYESAQVVEVDSEAALCNVRGVHLTEDDDVLTNLSLPGAKTVRRPMFQRLLSVPVKTQSKSKIPRSFSHPGALNNLPKFDKLKETLNFKSGFKGPGAKKHTKKGYTLVETEPPMIDKLHAVRFSMGADDFMAQELDNETPAPTKLPESDDLPIENHGKDSDIKPASSRAVPGNSPQSAGSMVKDPGKEMESFNKAVLFAALEKPSVTDRCTSTTELHLSSANKVSDIAQDFLNCLLSKRVLAIPIEFRRKIYMLLDTPRELFWDDYRLLAEKIGLGPDVILFLGQRNNKIELILQKFDAQEDPSIRRFMAILKEMERNDVVTVIEQWMLYEWNNNNSSSANC